MSILLARDAGAAQQASNILFIQFNLRRNNFYSFNMWFTVTANPLISRLPWERFYSCSLIDADRTNTLAFLYFLPSILRNKHPIPCSRIIFWCFTNFYNKITVWYIMKGRMWRVFLLQFARPTLFELLVVRKPKSHPFLPNFLSQNTTDKCSPSVPTKCSHD